MTTPLLSYQYNNKANRWTNPSTGRFVSESVVIEEMRQHQTATYSTLESLTRDLFAGRINVAEWQTSTALEIKDAHLAQAMFGAGGRANMTPKEWGRVGGTLADEYRYLTRFANEIANGSVSEAQALARINQYGNATQQSYWREYVGASSDLVYWILQPAEHCPDCLTLADGSPYKPGDLPTVPGAGSTRCRGNCKCVLERRASK